MDKFKNASSKLSKFNQHIDQDNFLHDKNSTGIINKNKASSTIKTFRLSNDDLKTLEKIRIGVNKESRGLISDNKIIKALIHIGSKTEPQKVLTALKETL